jgi:predicted RNase H-like HicB family nuclease
MPNDKYSAIVQWSDEDKCFIAIVPELPGVSAFGDSPEEAITELDTAKALTLEVYREDGLPLPEPAKLKPFSGQTRIRIPKTLHAELTAAAQLEGMSLNSFVNHLLTAKLERHHIIKKLDETQSMILNNMTIAHSTINVAGKSLFNEQAPSATFIYSGSVQ